MKIKLSFFVIGLVAINLACNHPVENQIIPESRHLNADIVCNYFFLFQDKFSIGIKRKGNIIMVDPLKFQGAVILKNDHLFMVDPKNAGKMFVYNTQTGQIDEIKTIHPDHFSENDAIRYADVLGPHLPLSFFHFDMRGYYQYTLENNKVKLNRQSFKLKGLHINSAEQLCESKYVILGFFREGLLGLFDSKSKKMKYYGHYPIPVDIPFESGAMERVVQSFQGNIAYSDQHSKVVYGSSNFAYLSCYHFTGKKLTFQWEKHLVPPPAIQIVDGFLVTDNTVTQGGFTDVTVAGDYIFACYTQRTVTDSVPDVTDSILVYDMTGNHIATFHIDFPISGIVVDIEKGTIYGISREYNKPIVVRFQFQI